MIIMYTGVACRPDLLSLQIQLVRKFVTPQPDRYIVFCDPTERSDMPKDILDETKRVCEKYGVEFVHYPFGRNRMLFKRTIHREVGEQNPKHILFMEEDVIPISPVYLTDETFVRTQGGKFTDQCFYVPGDCHIPEEFDFDIEYTIRRCRDEKCLPECVRGLGFHSSLNVSHEFYGPFVHYDKGCLPNYVHAAKGKDDFFNRIAEHFGAEPFKESFAHTMPLPRSFVDALGPKVYEMSITDIPQQVKPTWWQHLIETAKHKWLMHKYKRGQDMLIGDAIAWATTKLGVEPCPKCIQRKEFLNRLQVNLTKRQRVQADGSIILPQRGTPPAEAPEGYEIDPSNPFIFRLALDDCEHRSEGLVESGCCPHTAMVCAKYERRTDRLNCKNCVAHGGNK